MIRWGIYIPVITILLILLFHYLGRIFGKKVNGNVIDPSQPSVVRSFELFQTLQSILIFCFTGMITGFFIDRGLTKVYWGIGMNVWELTYLVLSFILALGFHDIYFYLTHRLLHLRFLFKIVHFKHHRSHPTNALSTFSFHPIEGIIQILVVPLVAFVIPLHEGVLLLFTAFLIFVSVYGHSGYELRPNKKGLFRIFNTSLHHYQHHEFVNYNFGIYLHLWDDIFGTNYPSYKEDVISIGKRIKSEKKSLNDRSLSSKTKP